MASTRTLAKSINMSFLQNNNKIIYVSLLVILSFFLFLDYIPGMHAYLWGIERSGFFNGREKWAKGFENQRV